MTTERKDHVDLQCLSWLRTTLALATLGLAVVLLLLLPSKAELSNGWWTPIIALEFAQSKNDLAWLMGPGARGLRDAFDLAHRFDMAFPFAYAGLLLMSFGPLVRRRIWFAGTIVTAVVIGADIGENIVLLKITQAIAHNTHSIGDLFAPLAWATWIKWLGIGVLAMLLAMTRWQRGRWKSLALSLVGGLAALAAIIKQPLFSEALALAVTAMIGVLSISALIDAALARTMREQGASEANGCA